MERLITEALKKAKSYEAMSRHAQEMLKIAKLVAADKTYNTFRRDDLLFKATSLSAEADVFLNKKDVCNRRRRRAAQDGSVPALGKSFAVREHPALRPG